MRLITRRALLALAALLLTPCWAVSDLQNPEAVLAAFYAQVDEGCRHACFFTALDSRDSAALADPSQDSPPQHTLYPGYNLLQLDNAVEGEEQLEPQITINCSATAVRSCLADPGVLSPRTIDVASPFEQQDMPVAHIRSQDVPNDSMNESSILIEVQSEPASADYRMGRVLIALLLLVLEVSRRTVKHMLTRSG